MYQTNLKTENEAVSFQKYLFSSLVTVVQLYTKIMGPLDIISMEMQCESGDLPITNILLSLNNNWETAMCCAEVQISILRLL